VLPVTGAYQIGELKKGKSVTFNRVKDWWGDGSATSSTASTRTG
jgi:microcin C transport system substrate-binding protein